MKIVCVGCSFTDGVVIGQPSYKHTYPYLLYESLSKCTVYNLGHKHSDNLFSYIVIKQAIEVLQPDIIIRQITSPQRVFQYKVDKKVWIFDYIRQNEDNYFTIDRGILSPNVHFFSSTGSTGRLFLGKQDKVRKYYYKHANENLMGYQSDAYLHAGDLLMQKNNVRNVTFSWFNSNIHNGCKSIENLVGFDKKYFCDEQGHFNKQGNLLVAKQIKKMIENE